MRFLLHHVCLPLRGGQLHCASRQTFRSPPESFRRHARKSRVPDRGVIECPCVGHCTDHLMLLSRYGSLGLRANLETPFRTPLFPPVQRRLVGPALDINRCHRFFTGAASVVAQALCHHSLSQSKSSIPVSVSVPSGPLRWVTVVISSDGSNGVPASSVTMEYSDISAENTAVSVPDRKSVV